MGRTVCVDGFHHGYYNGDKEVNESVRLRKDEEGVVLPNQVNLLDTTDPVLELTEK